MQNILVAFTVSKYNNNGKGGKQKNKMKIQTLQAKGKFAAIWLLLPLSLSPPLWAAAAADRYWGPSWIWLTHCRTLSWPGKLARYHRRHRWQHRCCRRCWVWWSGLPGLSTECWLKTAGSPEPRMSLRLPHDGLSLPLSLPIYLCPSFSRVCENVAKWHKKAGRLNGFRGEGTKWGMCHSIENPINKTERTYRAEFNKHRYILIMVSYNIK